MKDGYLQIKIRELDYKLKQQMQLAQNLEKQLQMVIDTKKEYKTLFNKLKRIDKFQENLLKEISKKNKIEMKSIFDNSHELINEYVKKSIDKNNKNMKKFFENELKKLENNQIDNELFQKLSKKINFIEQLNLLLMEELLKERVISNERLEIIKKRASIRANE
jgi:hypothetical protein